MFISTLKASERKRYKSTVFKGVAGTYSGYFPPSLGKSEVYVVSEIDTVDPCTLAQSGHLWSLAVTTPMILSTKGSNMTLGRCIGLQHIQKSAS